MKGNSRSCSTIIPSGTLVDTITDGIDGSNGVALDLAAPLKEDNSHARPFQDGLQSGSRNARARRRGLRGRSDDARRVRALPAGVPRGVSDPAHPGGGWLSPAAKSAKHLIYVADFLNNDIEIYPTTGSNPNPIGQITDGISGPEASYVDRHGRPIENEPTNVSGHAYRMVVPRANCCIPDSFTRRCLLSDSTAWS